MNSCPICNSSLEYKILIQGKPSQIFGLIVKTEYGCPICKGYKLMVSNEVGPENEYFYFTDSLNETTYRVERSFEGTFFVKWTPESNAADFIMYTDIILDFQKFNSIDKIKRLIILA